VAVFVAEARRRCRDICEGKHPVLQVRPTKRVLLASSGELFVSLFFSVFFLLSVLCCAFHLIFSSVLFFACGSRFSSPALHFSFCFFQTIQFSVYFISFFRLFLSASRSTVSILLV
jgi:hypothetical protein